MKLHVGGRLPKDGWTVLNAQPGPGVDLVGDIRDLSFLADASVEAVYASHVVEHVPLGAIVPTLAGIYRVLRPGGEFCVSVPDLAVLARSLLDARADLAKQVHLLQMVYGGQTDPWDVHYFGWTEELLGEYLRGVGFAVVTRVESFGLFADFSEYRPYGEPISLNLRARRPG